MLYLVECSLSVLLFFSSFCFFFFFKQKTAYEMRISDWSSDVCSSDLGQNPSARHSCLRDRCQLAKTDSGGLGAREPARMPHFITSQKKIKQTRARAPACQNMNAGSSHHHGASMRPPIMMPSNPKDGGRNGAERPEESRGWKESVR